MDNDDNQHQHLIPKSVETNDEHSLVLELPKNDPLFEKKKKLLEAVGFDTKGRVYFKRSANTDLLNSVLEVMHQRARIINLNEVDLYFIEGDTIGALEFYNSRNELDALHSILAIIDNSILTAKSTQFSGMLYLRNATINMIQIVGNQINEDTKVISECSTEKEKLLLQWGISNGVLTKLDIAHVEDAGRGAIANENLKLGDVALEVPLSLIISEEFVHESDMFPVLEKIEGVSSETMMLLWSMREKYNPNSRFKPYFDTLPKSFNTGLSFGIDAIMALEGTLLLEEIIHAKEHLRTQYDELFPLLSNDYPHVFAPELYTWDHFLWACELWYSNSMKVMFPDAKLRTCLIPVAGFLNHSICPHIMNYGKVDSTTNSFKFRVSRACNEGEQCFLSYGNLSSSHLLTFYGFLPKGDNPCDAIPLDIDVTNADGFDDDYQKDSDRTVDMVRGTWFSKNHGIFYYGLPHCLLDNLRKARNPMMRTNTLTQENLEIEMEVLEDLRSTFEDMLVNLGDPKSEDREDMYWDVKLALEFKDLQRKIVSSIVSSCCSGSNLVQHHLSNFI